MSKQQFNEAKLAVHFHDTFDTAIENILTAMTFGNFYVYFPLGIRVVDSSIGGLGGCPYSMKPVGNVCTENVAFVLEKAGFDTGLNLDILKKSGDWIC
jgi:hydroxymethylglutaryl-CoA lyase